MDVYILTAKKAFVNSTIYIMKAKCQKSLLSVQSVKRLKKLMLSCDRASTMTLQPLNTDRFCPPALSASLSGVEIGAERAKNQVSRNGVVSEWQNTVQREWRGAEGHGAGVKQ